MSDRKPVLLFDDDADNCADTDGLFHTVRVNPLYGLQLTDLERACNDLSLNHWAVPTSSSLNFDNCAGVVNSCRNSPTILQDRGGGVGGIGEGGVDREQRSQAVSCDDD